MSRPAREPAAKAAAAEPAGRQERATARPEPSTGGLPGNQLLQAAAGGGSPLDAPTRRQGEARLGVDLSGVRLHRGAAADRVTAGLGARALSRGDSILLGGAADRRSLGHELLHVAQERRLGRRDERPLSTGGDAAEQEAVRWADDLWRPGPVLPLAQAPRAAVSREDGPAAPEPGWSFDPYAEDVVGLGNHDLVLRTLAVRQWLANHSLVELDYEAHLILRDRLDLERDFRIELGHLWLEEIEQGATLSLVRLMQGANGALDIVAVSNPDLINGTAQDLGGEPIMSTAQFEAYLTRNGIGRVRLEDYLAEVARVQFGASEDFVPGQPGSDRPPSGTAFSRFDTGDPRTLPPGEDAAAELARLYGISGANAYASPRDVALTRAFGNQSPAGRQGAISEAYFGTGPDALYGFGVIDQNVRTPSHPRTDFQLLFGDQFDLSVKSRVPGTAASQSGSLTQQYHNYLEGHARLLGADPGYRGFDQFMATSARGRTAAEVRAQSALVVDASDFEGYRGLLADPLSSSGGASDLPNYQRSAVTRIYDGVLQDRPIDVGDGGPSLRTIADLDAALQSGRIGIMQHTALLNGVSAEAAAQVRPNIGFGTPQSQAFHDAFGGLHPGLRPEAPPAPAQRFSASRRTGTARAGSASRLDQFSSYLRNQSEMFGEGGRLLHVDPADVPAYQALLRDPFAREPTAGGGASPRRNYQRADLTRVYDGLLAATPVRSAAGEEFRSVAALDQALEQGRLTTREHYQLVDRVGRMAARTVAPDVPTPTTAAEARARADYDSARARANDYIRRVASPEYMHSVGQGGGLRGDLHAMRTYGGRGGLLGVAMGGGMEAWNSREQGFGNLETWERIGGAAGREGLRSGLSSSLETAAASRTSAYLLREGLEVSAARSLAMRGASRAVPGGVVDIGFEGYSILTEDREHSAGEVSYRMGRSFVIGGASAAAGSAMGAAAAGAVAGSVVPGVGTAIGFVVGLIGGALVGWALSETIPRYDELGGGPARDSSGNRVMFRSEYDRYLAEGRCLPSHHQRIHVIEDPFDFAQRPSLLPLLPAAQAAPSDPRAHAAPQPPSWQQTSPADLAAIQAWIEASGPTTAGP